MLSGKPHGRGRTARGHSSPPLSLQFVERPIYPATRSSVIPLWSGRGGQGTPAGLEVLPQCRDRVQSSRIGVLRARWRQASSTGSSRLAGETPWPASRRCRTQVQRPVFRCGSILRVEADCSRCSLSLHHGSAPRRSASATPGAGAAAQRVPQVLSGCAEITALHSAWNCRWAQLRAMGGRASGRAADGDPKNCGVQKARSLRSSPVYKDGLEPDGPYHRLIAARCDKSVAAARSGLFCALRSRTATWTSASPGAECAWTPAHALFPFGGAKRPCRTAPREKTAPELTVEPRDKSPRATVASTDLPSDTWARRCRATGKRRPESGKS
jgi:hypothetical protein